MKATDWLNDPDPPAGDPPSRAGQPLEGRVLDGRYRLDDLIAEGGFAQVWRAFDTDLQRISAVRIPKRTAVGTSEAFLAEARRVARLKHPAILPVYDVGLDAGGCYFVTEYVEGGSLADRLKNGKISAAQACRWIVSIADALDHAHRFGIVHRDVKPPYSATEPRALHREIESGATLSKDVPNRLAPACRKALYKDTGQRFGSAAEFAAAIRHSLNNTWRGLLVAAAATSLLIAAVSAWGFTSRFAADGRRGKTAVTSGAGRDVVVDFVTVGDAGNYTYRVIGDAIADHANENPHRWKALGKARFDRESLELSNIANWGWSSGSWDTLAPVDMFPNSTSAYGCHCMSGNVAEWVEPKGTFSHSLGIIRGGFWWEGASLPNSAYRGAGPRRKGEPTIRFPHCCEEGIARHGRLKPTLQEGQASACRTDGRAYRMPPWVRHGVMWEGWSRNQMRSHSSVIARRSSDV